MSGPRLRFLVPDHPDRDRQDRAGEPGGAGWACRSAIASWPWRVSRWPIFRRWCRSSSRARARRSTFAIDRKGERLDVPIEVEAQRDGDRMIGRIGIQPAAGLRRAGEHADHRTLRAGQRRRSRDRKDLGHVAADGPHDLERGHRRRLGQEPERADQHRGVRRFFRATGHTVVPVLPRGREREPVRAESAADPDPRWRPGRLPAGRSS